MRWIDERGTVGKGISELPKESTECQEDIVKFFNETKAIMFRPGKILAKHSRPITEMIPQRQRQAN